ncbi:Transmembrane ascorbate ferrireductase [Arachis hypogaea]|nr:Transmembrane ascorbate ferrireductase [Arachis hypogaea]
MIFGVAGIDPERRAELIKMLLDTQVVKTILLEIPSLGRQNVASILIFSQSFGGTLHLTDKLFFLLAQAYQLLLHLSSYFSDWEIKGEKLKKMGLGVPALPFTFVAHLLAVAAIVMVLLWNIHFRGGLAWEATNKNLIFNVCFLFHLALYSLFAIIFGTMMH